MKAVILLFLIGYSLSYNAGAAVQYARTYCKNYNKNYPNYCAFQIFFFVVFYHVDLLLKFFVLV